MRFQITLIEPPGERFVHFLFDLIRYVQHSLELLGHECVLGRNRCDPKSTNILVGTHLLATEIDVDLLLGGARDYVVLQTEILGDGVVNGIRVSDRKERVLYPLLHGARAVWDGLDTNVEVLAKRGVRASLLRFGFDPLIEEIHHKSQKDIDFLFYGSLGPWRRSVLGKLEALGYSVHQEFDAVSLFRNDLIARAEVVLTLRHGDGMAHLPQGRIIYAVNNRCLVVGEGGYGQEQLEDVFLWTNEPNDVVDLCRSARARADRQELRETFYERLRSRPMTAFVAPLVADLEGRAKVA
jgi:hypothetical protein